MLTRSQSHSNDTQINLEEVINELLMVLSDKERVVITKRFSLDSGPRQTLESIGQSFSVTRERIRQIENIALRKLQRNADNSRIRRISHTISEILQQYGGLCNEKMIITETLAKIHGTTTSVNGHIIRLTLSIMSSVMRSDSPKLFHRFWYDKNSISMPDVKRIAKIAYQIMNKKGDLMRITDLAEKVAKQGKMSPNEYERILSIIQSDIRFKKIKENLWGLQEWRHINPKSIHDKALIVMRKLRKPMHFIEIANTISAEGFDTRPVTVQAVHNDLIRYADFVLIGRGVYALREWGYNPGTVADVIALLLKEQGPLSKKEIVKKVQEQRDVKVGTISLNLQKEAAFMRVGRAMYDFDESKWAPQTLGRGRKKKAMIEQEEGKQI